MNKWLVRFYLLALLLPLVTTLKSQNTKPELETIFNHPPESAKPGVLWMWMGSNLSREGITKDLVALKKAGFNRTTMFSLADITTPWAGEIQNSPTPELMAWTEPWWKLVRFAAEESKRLKMDFGMFNCPGYESSGGTWITPDMAMQEICWSKQDVEGLTTINTRLAKPTVNLQANEKFPVFNPRTGLVEKPEIPERGTYYKDIAVMAMPAAGTVDKQAVIDLSKNMEADGTLNWKAPAGKWTIYRFGHTLMGGLIQPAQWKASGFECDKMNPAAVSFHMDHVIGEVQKHLGDLVGNGFTHLHFDSYEAGYPTWTPNMQQEFRQRRGYSLLPFLATFAGRNIGGKNDSLAFRKDFDATIKDLYRDVYFTTIARKLKAAGLDFLCEPYGGPWRQNEIMPLLQKVMTEFWTIRGKFYPLELDATVTALRQSGKNIVEAEAFTGQPKDSKWTETPAWLKPIGDAAFCAGVNQMVLHRFVHQPWDDQYKPGATMGQWGTHFDRTQTWWNTMPELVKYWSRCQALLQWGSVVLPNEDSLATVIDSSKITIKSIHRKLGREDIYFIANTTHFKGVANCSFNISDRQPELWDPVTGKIKSDLYFTVKNGITSTSVLFDDAQSFFVVFRKKTTAPTTVNKQPISTARELIVLNNDWQVSFTSALGGPSKPVRFTSLQDWSQHENTGIKYYSGTATYRKMFNVSINNHQDIYLDLGVVENIAHVYLNKKDLGIVWTAPWQVKIPASLLKSTGNQLEIAVTNTWANRLVGDEQEPDDCEWIPGHSKDSSQSLKAFPAWFLQKQPRPSKGRYCFTTWKYFTKSSPLLPAGLLGPVRLIYHE